MQTLETKEPRLFKALVDSLGAQALLGTVGSRVGQVDFRHRRKCVAGVDLASTEHRSRVRLASGYRPPIGGSLTDALQVGADVRIGCKIDRQKQTHGGERDHDHDIGRRELATREVRGLAKPRVHESHHAVEPALHRHLHRMVSGQRQAIHVHDATYRRLQVAIGQMEPVEEVGCAD